MLYLMNINASQNKLHTTEKNAAKELRIFTHKLKTVNVFLH